MAIRILSSENVDGALTIGGALTGTTASFTRLDINASNTKLKGDLLGNADAAYDIGASGANRPRNLYLSNSITAGDITTTGVGSFGGDVKIYKANALLELGENSTGGNFGFIGWDDASNYLFIGNSYSSAYNKNIVISNTGKVGIGTTEPKGVLSVDSGVAKTSTTFTRIASFKTSEAYASYPLELSIAQRGNATAASQNIEIQVGHYGLDFDANLILQADGGKVGIGTTSPDAILQVQAVSSGSIYSQWYIK